MQALGNTKPFHGHSQAVDCMSFMPSTSVVDSFYTYCKHTTCDGTVQQVMREPTWSACQRHPQLLAGFTAKHLQSQLCSYCSGCATAAAEAVLSSHQQRLCSYQQSTPHKVGIARAGREQPALDRSHFRTKVRTDRKPSGIPNFAPVALSAYRRALATR